jgi:leader peptidase (prepilin peptidase)/N-methyltransferase
VLSWLFLLGRCASCKEPISARYPLVEALHGVGFALIVWKFGLRPFTLMLLVFFSAMVVLALIDWDHQILPDVITLPGILAGIFGTFLPGALIDWREAGLSVTFGYVAFFLVAEGYLRLRGIEGLGQGDWKLAAMMGAFLGWQRLLLTVFLGSVSGMTYGLIQAFKQRAEVDLHAPSPSPSLPLDSAAPQPGAPLEEIADAQPAPIGKYKLPFGTFLAASAIVVLFVGDPVLIWYGSLFQP